MKISEYAKKNSIVQQLKHIDTYGLMKGKIDIYNQPIFVFYISTNCPKMSFRSIGYLGLSYFSSLVKGQISELNTTSFLFKEYLRVQQLIESYIYTWGYYNSWWEYFRKTDLKVIGDDFNTYSYLSIEDKGLIKEILAGIMKDRKEELERKKSKCSCEARGPDYKEQKCEYCNCWIPNFKKHIHIFEEKFEDIHTILKTTLKTNVTTLDKIYRFWVSDILPPPKRIPNFGWGLLAT